MGGWILLHGAEEQGGWGKEACCMGLRSRVDEAMEQVMVIKSTRPTQTAVRGEICLENV